ncbi:MAG TPA: DUF2157 domain-containing protein, partial [Bacillota bacterium]
MASGGLPRDFSSALRDESSGWVGRGLISEDQRGSILGLYPEPVAAGRDRLVLILSLLGRTLVAAGTILFFSANWPKIAAWVKVASVLAVIAATYGLGFHLAYRRKDHPRLGQALIFLGALFYGAGIWLIAQVFHFDSQWPTGFLVWGAGVLPVAWVTSSQPILYLSAATLTIWTISAQTAAGTYPVLYPAMLLLLVLPAARRLRAWMVEWAVLAGLLLWFLIGVSAHLYGAGSFNPLPTAGRLILLYGLAVTPIGLAGLGDPRAYLSTGALAGLGGIYCLAFGRVGYSPGPPLPPFLVGPPDLIAGEVILVVGLAIAAWTYWRTGRSERVFLLPALGVLGVAAILADVPGAAARVILFNLLLLGGTVGVIVLGIRQRLGWLVNIGLSVFVVHVLTRYFDLFFS